MMQASSYRLRRNELEEYFDRTAAEAWAKLTSDAPLRGIRATVRAGRDRMRATLLSYLPEDLRGQRVLDAGCGTGARALAAAQRGADVLAVDLSSTLVGLARERTPAHALLGPGRIEFRVSDMLAGDLGQFDWVVAMDSLIHYRATDLAALVSQLAARAERGVVFTFAPRTPLLTVMHTLGRALPRGSRAPAIEPISERHLRQLLAADPALANVGVGRCERIDSSFYISNTMELLRS